MNKDFRQRVICCFLIGTFGVAAQSILAGNVQAETLMTVSTHDRDQIVSDALKRMESQNNLQWSDIGSLDDYFEQSHLKRNKIITQAMDNAQIRAAKSSRETPDFASSDPSYAIPQQRYPYEDSFSEENIEYDSKKLSPLVASAFGRQEPSLAVQEPPTRIKKKWNDISAEAGMKTGYRFDKLLWNIAGNMQGNSPNILSELSWPEIHVANFQVDGKVVVADLVRFEALLDYGWIMDGKNQDSDYSGSDRTGEFSRSNNSTDDDNVADVVLGTGMQFNLSRRPVDMLLVDELWCAVLGGFSHHEQNLRITDGFQTIPATGGFGGLNSTYETQWDSYWAGIEFFGSKKKFKGYLRMQYHWADYRAEADWNLRSDFAHPVSFVHTADGSGVVWRMGGNYPIGKRWDLHLSMDMQHWKAGHGLDRTFNSNGGSSDTQFNEVIWDSYAFMIGATYYFSK